MSNITTKPETSPAKRGASGEPDFVDVIFAKFGAWYGRHWLEMWAGIPLAGAKSEWREALSELRSQQVEDGMKSVRERCKFPPTLPEFVAICQSFHRHEPFKTALPPPRTPPPKDWHKTLPANLRGPLKAAADAVVKANEMDVD